MKRMPSRSAAAWTSYSACAVIMVPVGLAGLATRTPLSGARRSGGLDQHRLATECLEDVAIGRIAGNRDRHPVTRLEQSEERQDEAGRRSGRDDDPRRIDYHAIALLIVTRDARAQRGDA